MDAAINFAYLISGTSVDTVNLGFIESVHRKGVSNIAVDAEVLAPASCHFRRADLTPNGVEQYIF
jgi:hypothetical protein